MEVIMARSLADLIDFPMVTGTDERSIEFNKEQARRKEEFLRELALIDLRASIRRTWMRWL